MKQIYFTRKIEAKLYEELISYIDNNDPYDYIDYYIESRYNARIIDYYIEFSNDKDYTMFVLKYGT